MLQKYFPVVGEVNSPLAMMAALGFTSNAAEIAIKGVSNEVLETMLWASVEEAPAHKKEVEVSISKFEEARKEAAKALKAARYRAACAARLARSVSKLSRRIKAARRPATKASLRGLSGLSLEVCRAKAVNAQAAVRSAVNTYNSAAEAVETAGDVRAIRTCVAALKASVRELEVAHLNFRFAREMLSISLARHSA